MSQMNLPPIRQKPRITQLIQAGRDRGTPPRLRMMSIVHERAEGAEFTDGPLPLSAIRAHSASVGVSEQSRTAFSIPRQWSCMAR